MQKLMAFDIDGTLLFEHGITPESLEAITAWRKAGHLAVCSTGKSIYATRKALTPYGLTFDYYVTFTGAVVTDKDFNPIHHKTLPTPLVRQVFTKASTYQGLNFYGSTLEADVELYNSTGTHSPILPGCEPFDLENLDSTTFIGAPIWAPVEEIRDEIFTWLTQNFADRVDLHKNQTFIDIVPPHSTKGSGLSLLTNHLRTQGLVAGELQTLTIGDSWNDLPMHAWSNISASFPYSPPEVQEATSLIVETAADFIYQNL